MTKVVFVNAFEYNYLGTRVLASYLRKFGHKTHNILLGYEASMWEEILREEILREKYEGYMVLYKGKFVNHVAHHFPLSPEDFCALETVLQEEAPDIIGFSARSTNNYLIPLLVPVFRSAAPQALLAAGGFGPTLEPDLYLDGGFDVVVRGDGEEAVLELATYHEKNDLKNAIHILNTYWSKDFGGNRNPMRDQEKKLDKYPIHLCGHEAFSFIAGNNLKRYYDPALDSDTYITYFGRGCAGKCTYCSGGQWRSIYRNDGKKAYPRRNRSMHDVLAECSSLPEHIKYICFTDEYWSMSKQQAFEFFSQYRNMVHKPFWAYLHYEQMIKDKDLFELVMDAGFANTGIGFQTGSGEFLREYYGRVPKYDILLQYAHMLYNNFIRCDAQFISGNCYETMEDFYKTLDLIRKLPFNIEQPYVMNLQMTRLRPHPKTPLTFIAPRVVTDPMPANQWLYRSILMNLANKMDEGDLREVMSVKMFERDVFLLYDFSQSWLYRQQQRHYEKMLAEEADKDWIFYGAGKNYQSNKKFFAPLKPRVILVDRDYLTDEREIDGIPIACAEDFFANGGSDKESRYLIFVNPAFPVAKNLLRTYKVPRKHIHACEIGLLC